MHMPKQKNISHYPKLNALSPSIELTINREQVIVPIYSILYVNVEDKLCTICLTSKKQLRRFMPMNQIEPLLPKEQFLKISRSCIVAYSAIEQITKDSVILHDQTVLKFSLRQKKSIASLYNAFLNRQHAKSELHSHRIISDSADNFKSFDNMPVGFLVLEALINAKTKKTDMIIRYANNSVAKIGEIPVDALLDNSIANVFPEMDAKWTQICIHAALHNIYRESMEYRPHLKKYLYIKCYPISYGFCGCIISDISHFFRNNSIEHLLNLAPEQPVISALKKIQ